MSKWTLVKIVVTTNPTPGFDHEWVYQHLKWCDSEDADAVMRIVKDGPALVTDYLNKQVTVPSGQEGSLTVQWFPWRLCLYGNLRNAYSTPDQIAQWTMAFCDKLPPGCLVRADVDVQFDDLWHKWTWTKRFKWRNLKNQNKTERDNGTQSKDRIK